MVVKNSISQSIMDRVIFRVKQNNLENNNRSKTKITLKFVLYIKRDMTTCKNKTLKKYKMFSLFNFNKFFFDTLKISKWCVQNTIYRIQNLQK